MSFLSEINLANMFVALLHFILCTAFNQLLLLLAKKKSKQRIFLFSFFKN